MAGPGGEQLEHALVGAAALAGQGVADQVGEVEVAHRDGVGVARATIATSAEVQGPTPGRAWRRRWASAAGMATVSSTRRARLAAITMVAVRLRSTPRGWNAQ